MVPLLGELRHFGDLLRRNSRSYGSRPGLAWESANGVEQFTWRQVEARSHRLGHALGRRGLQRGDRVGIVADNSVAFVEALFALAGLGLVAVPINTRLTGEEVAGILDDCEATGLLVGDSHLEMAHGTAGGVSTLRFVGGLGLGGGDIPSHAELIGDESESEPAAEHPIAGDDLAMLLYTSGTTGFPKGVMYTHRRMLLGTLIHVLAIGSAHRHRVLLPSPLYSAAGIAGIACAVAVGSPTWIVQFSLDRVLKTLAEQRITFTNLVPTTVRLLLEDPDFDRHDLSSLEVLLYGGSPMPEPTLRFAASRLQCGYRQTFATSETGLSGTVLEPEDHRRALDDPEAAHLLLSCGRPQIGVGVRLVDERGAEVEDGEIGEVAIACDGNMIGYWNRPEATAEVLRDGWVHTGDLARRDREGYFYLVDRKHDMIVTGALNVYPTEIERSILEHPQVADCAVVGVPDSKWGEAVKAFVVVRSGSDEPLTEAGLLGYCRHHLAGHKRPKSIDFVTEIPRNPAGKPLRRVLREPYWQAAGRQIG